MYANKNCHPINHLELCQSHTYDCTRRLQQNISFPNHFAYPCKRILWLRTSSRRKRGVINYYKTKEYIYCGKYYISANALLSSRGAKTIRRLPPENFHCVMMECTRCRCVSIRWNVRTFHTKILFAYNKNEFLIKKITNYV